MGSRGQREDSFDESLHALPSWFAWFQKTFGLSFIVLAEAYLMGSLATEGWVKELTFDAVFDSFRGVGVIFFFLAGVAVAGIGLTCSVVFVGSVKRKQAFMAFFTGVGMLLFFGVEVWASLSERSLYILATPADLAVLSALGFRGHPPISPTILVVSLLFPLGSLFFGFVQQRRAAVTEMDIEEDALEMERKIRLAELQAKLEVANAKKNAAKAAGAVNMVKAGVQAAKTTSGAGSVTIAPASDSATDEEDGEADEGGSARGRRTPEQMDVLRVQMLTEGYSLAELSEKENERVWGSLIEKRRQAQVLALLSWSPAQYDEALKRVRQQPQATGRSS
ncbi:MAG: hypothetical protein ACXWQ5_22790, partial [Ktedonobacterales bacterium]